MRALRVAWAAFVAWFNARRLDENTILLVFALAVGVAGALGVVVFFKLIDLAFVVLYSWPVRYIRGIDFPIYRPVVTAVGFAIAAWLARRFAGGEDGPKVPYVQLAVARRGGEVPTLAGTAHAAASAITLGSGGSAGSEGPTAVLGATFGSALGRAFRFDANRIKVLTGAGAAAGISAAFNAPLAGAFFALEEILGNFSIAAFPPVVVASVLAAVISRAVFGNHPSFPIPHEYGYALARELVIFYPLLGVVGGLVAALFVRTQRFTGDVVRKLPLPAAALPWISGLVVGGMVLASGGMLVGYGHLAIRVQMFGGMAFWVLALLTLGKILATAITLNGGGSGGLFTPSLYIGAVMGGAFGVGMAHLFPSLNLSPEAYGLVGMGCMVAAATHAPITAILLVFEMTNDYAIVIPLMLAVVVAYLVERAVEPESLYTLWLTRRGERLEHGADRDVLAHLPVSGAYEPHPRIIPEAAPVAELVLYLGSGEQTEFPVVDAAARLVGVITLADLARVAQNQEDLAQLLVAADIAQPTESVTPEQSLLEATRRMGVRGTGSLPVLDAAGRLRGLVTRAHVLA
ncbi:MAG TPA: chloride channel protein, partial [Longimicrobiales bacterium]